MTVSAALAAASRAMSAVSAQRSLQLDLFRGFAAICMVFNHSGNQLLGEAAASGDWPSWLVFTGSAAPALFFFATGMGAGFSIGTVVMIGTHWRTIFDANLAAQLCLYGLGALCFLRRAPPCTLSRLSMI